ncbi:type II secretion system major pseudopilin GspG [Methylonatrum kenyense]|uniref:type II secretion system major pseudopilin GspG n=1 Tax=Methylonatrum kenyense TaxID=455253 RepID=UPI0020BF7597|nr:type II secretion system major pseudopilin GspG [Methylonatrum kenyense]MCK8517031.1 type II secretion system major pseudopilin GspG [Methylonatrum kenyense]
MQPLSRFSRRSGAALQRGFTLIEVMVVVVILGILVAFAVPNIMDNPERARITKAEHDIRAIENALEMYRMDNFRYPTTDQGLRALVERPSSPPEPRNWKSGGYMRSLPSDPWGGEYQYRAPDNQGERVRVYTYGADGRPGGEGENAEISNLDLD